MPLPVSPREKRNAKPSATKTRPKRIGMTIAIASRATTGVLLYADKKIIASDGATTEGCKIYRRRLPDDGFIALASAADDAVASEALAIDLMAHANGVQDQSMIWGAIQQAMVRWCEPYPPNELPSIQYLMALRTSNIARLYLLQLRNQIVPVSVKRAIGAGSRIVDAMLDDVLPDDFIFHPKVALFNMAYMARKAKDSESSVGGGSRSNAIFIPHRGSAHWVNEIELFSAEEHAALVDDELNHIRMLIMGLGTIGPVERMAEGYKNLIVTMANSYAESVQFPSLDDDSNEATLSEPETSEDQP